MAEEKVLQYIGLIPETDETGQAPAATPALFNNPFGKAQENFDALEPIAQDVIGAKGDSASLTAKMESVQSAIGNLETSDAVSVAKAVKLAWARSDEGYAVEQFASNMTLINFEPINVTRTVSGDDSVDVDSTSTLKVGSTYVLSGNGGQESITISEVLNGTRFKATTNLTRTLSDGNLGQTDWTINAGYAVAPAGGTYYSSAMDVLRYYGDGRLDIRRDNDEGKLDVSVRTKDGNWQDAKLLEVTEEEAGKRNEFYELPVGGIVELKLVADKVIQVDYLMVYTSPEAGRAYPVAQSTNLTPAAGAVSVNDPVTLTGTAPRSLYGIAIASAEVHIATDSGMQNVIYTGTVENPTGELAHTATGGTLEVDKNYWWDFIYIDEDGNRSPASKATGFSTAETFEYVVPPLIITPANNSADVMAPLTVRLAEFAVFNAVDTHAGSRIEASNSPDFSVILFDSGELAPDAEIQITEENGLAVATDLYIRGYHKGETLGWSAAGAVCKVRMADKFNAWPLYNGSMNGIPIQVFLPSTSPYYYSAASPDPNTILFMHNEINPNRMFVCELNRETDSLLWARSNVAQPAADLDYINSVDGGKGAALRMDESTCLFSYLTGNSANTAHIMEWRKVGGIWGKGSELSTPTGYGQSNYCMVRINADLAMQVVSTTSTNMQVKLVQRTAGSWSYVQTLNITTSAAATDIYLCAFDDLSVALLWRDSEYRYSFITRPSVDDSWAASAFYTPPMNMSSGYTFLPVSSTQAFVSSNNFIRELVRESPTSHVLTANAIEDFTNYYPRDILHYGGTIFASYSESVNHTTETYTMTHTDSGWVRKSGGVLDLYSAFVPLDTGMADGSVTLASIGSSSSGRPAEGAYLTPIVAG